jgi:hypothetical protein
MSESVTKLILEPNRFYKLSTVLSILISSVLLVAAYGKFFYPLENLKIFDRGVSGLEILFVLGISLFRKKWWVWLGAAMIFAAWLGYAMYWSYLQLPCSCMGSMVEMPSGLSVSLDACFFIASLTMGFLLGAQRDSLYLTVLLSCLFALVGYALADWIYQELILKEALSFRDRSQTKLLSIFWFF